MGVFDLPHVIDHILRETNKPKVNYVGLEMGTTMLYVLMSEKREYSEKIERVVALSPTMFFQHPESRLKFITDISNAGDGTPVFKVSPFKLFFRRDVGRNSNEFSVMTSNGSLRLN